MRLLILAAGAALTLSACGDRDADTTTVNTTTVDANAMATDNMMIDANGMTVDANGMTVDGNMAVDPATQNAMQQDLQTNDPDTNLANGM